MTNRERARKLMLLVQCGLNGHADELEWAEILRRHLETRAGRPLDQRQWDDGLGQWSLLS